MIATYANGEPTADAADIYSWYRTWPNYCMQAADGKRVTTSGIMQLSVGSVGPPHMYALHNASYRSFEIAWDALAACKTHLVLNEGHQRRDDNRDT